jgi:hypothetical protein
MINRKARPADPIRLSLTPLNESSKRGKPTTLTIAIQLNSRALYRAGRLFKETP